MIIFDLSCDHDHPFEGWFESQASYDSQLESGLISCPHCGSTRIRRVPSAVHLAKAAVTPEPTSLPPQVDTRSGIRVAYQQLVSAIIANSEDVGQDFADEARKIHYMEAPQRSIRGEATADDYETLREEGIDVLRLPIIKKTDLN